MNLHKQARFTPRGRAPLVRRILVRVRVEVAAKAAGVTRRTAYKWLKSFGNEGEFGLANRSSRPLACPHATPEAKRWQELEQQRARKTCRQIAVELGLSISTVARLFKRAGLHRPVDLEPEAP